MVGTKYLALSGIQKVKFFHRPACVGFFCFVFIRKECGSNYETELSRFYKSSDSKINLISIFKWFSFHLLLCPFLRLLSRDWLKEMENGHVEIMASITHHLMSSHWVSVLGISVWSHLLNFNEWQFSEAPKCAPSTVIMGRWLFHAVSVFGRASRNGKFSLSFSFDRF